MKLFKKSNLLRGSHPAPVDQALLLLLRLALCFLLFLLANAGADYEKENDSQDHE